MGRANYHRYLTPRRLALERQAVRQEYPGFNLERLADGRLYWAGRLRTPFKRAYDIRVVYSQNYPLSEPGIYVVRPRIYSAYLRPGDFGRMQLCRYSEEGMWSPDRGTPVVTIRQAAEWLFRHDRHERRQVSFLDPLSAEEKEMCVSASRDISAS